MEVSEDGEAVGLWAHATRDESDYHERPLSEESRRDVEGKLGVRLPAAYVALARDHNGGRLARNAFPTATPTTWAPDHVAVTGIFAIGATAASSLCGAAGQQFWLEEWGYPAIGVYFADTPSAGHDLLALDYRDCGPEGEPAVVHVDQEAGYLVTVLTPTFEAFLEGLVSASQFD